MREANYERNQKAIKAAVIIKRRDVEFATKVVRAVEQEAKNHGKKSDKPRKKSDKSDKPQEFSSK